MIEVNYREVEMKDLVAAFYNPRDIDYENQMALTKSLERFGLVQPIVWNEATGHIVGGHQRYNILRRKGVNKTTVVVVNLSDDEEKALNLTLNNPEIEGNWTDFAEDLLETIKTDDKQLFDDLGFEELQVDIEKMITQQEFEDKEIDGQATCPCCDFSWMYDDRDIVDINKVDENGE